MARRSDHSREELHALALAAAREIAEKEGMSRLTSRRIAARNGYSVGTLYNLFDNLDELILRLNGTTLDALFEALVGLRLDEQPEAAVRTLAEGYIRFVRDHPKLWNLQFQHHWPDGQPIPDWHEESVRRVLGLLERALAPLFAPGQEAERLHTARVLWSSLHGMVSLEGADRLAATESLEAMADSLATNYLAGLRARRGSSERAS